MEVEKHEEIIIKLSIKEATILAATLGALSNNDKVESYEKLTGQTLPMQEAHNFNLWSLLEKNLRNHIKKLQKN